MKVTVIPVTPFQQNCSVLACENSGRGAVVDPGGDLDRVLDAIDRAGVDIEKIFVTHGHLDHAGGVAELAQILKVPVEGPQLEDRFWIDAMQEQASMFGFTPARKFEPDRWLEQGDTVNFGQITLQVIHCPGHTPGHVIFFDSQSKLAFVGDVLFRGSIGRTDFPRGNHSDLINSIRNRLWPLGNDVQFVPGHGPTSTFGYERLHNPFVSDAVLGASA